jgi:UDP-N-acetylmuramyl tripeptide synthase
VTNHLTTTFVAAEMRRRDYEVFEGPEAEILGGAADSRKVQSGDLFTAFSGETSDGRRSGSDLLPAARR